MGLFDTVRFQYRLPDQKLQDKEFQTDSLGQGMMSFIVQVNGRLSVDLGAFIDFMHDDILYGISSCQYPKEDKFMLENSWQRQNAVRVARMIEVELGCRPSADTSYRDLWTLDFDGGIEVNTAEPIDGMHPGYMIHFEQGHVKAMRRKDILE